MERAFAAVGLGAASMLGSRYSMVLAMLGSDLLVLLGFVLLHVAVLDLLERARIVPRLGLVLLGIQVVADLIFLSGHGTLSQRIAVASFLIAAQCLETAWVLWQFGRAKVRTPAVFCAVLDAVFGVFNLCRGCIEAFGLIHSGRVHYWFTVWSFAFFIGLALGLAFGFFWMTTAVLSAGLEHMASTDPLTRILNRRTFLMWCEKELGKSMRDNRPFSILMVDLDHFKRINDTFGHHVGDEAICAAVEKMQDSIRGIDVLARWGGEEFAVLLPNANPEAALIVAERMRSNIEKIHLDVEASGASGVRTLRLTASIGMATYRAYDDVLSVLHRADKGLYQAKGAGRNRVLCTQ